MSVLNAVLRLLKKEEQQLNRELTAITAAVAAFGKTYVNGTSTRSRSAAGRVQVGARKKARRAIARKTPIILIQSKRTQPTIVGKKRVAAQKARSVKIKEARKSA